MVILMSGNVSGILSKSFCYKHQFPRPSNFVLCSSLNILCWRKLIPQLSLGREREDAGQVCCCHDEVYEGGGL